MKVKNIHVPFEVFANLKINDKSIPYKKMFPGLQGVLYCFTSKSAAKKFAKEANVQQILTFDIKGKE